ncbi:DUF3810 domain-containing protein [Lutibacter sp. A80]|uniref:DUF3810 domain-containing protein n=1 Tax=Lutibacter sp. A80 TaxID=2918453 RepID=UPI001F0537DB|nr:DUF3810 domain-containing protein [Lutibacter sp. A80]UMB61242.1 DUF3810 domain-containing protein [Lutibacter sp. A80]
MNSKKYYIILSILLVMQWAFIQIIAQFPNFIETYYSNGLYIYISNFLRILLGWIPFSFGDLMYAALVIFILRAFYKAIKSKKINFKATFFKITGILSIVFFVFHFNWALNYFRLPINNSLNFKISNYSNEELIDFTKKLITKTNEVHTFITKNDTLVVENLLTKNQIKAKVENAYNQLEKKHPQFKYSNPKVKHSLFSVPLTYMGFGGYINPITNESQVNSLIPKNNYAATACHEAAHQIGIASESEANFVGYLATTNSNDIFFKYSGYLMALRYCISEVYRKDPASFEIIKPLINKGILKDIKQSQAFWESYQNKSEKYFKIFYDNFLKANKQKDGIEGYSKMVVLLINYHKNVDLTP